MNRDEIMYFFDATHLPEPLKTVSQAFGDLATWLDKQFPANAEADVAIRKLLEAKDAGVRALVLNRRGGQ